MLQELLKAWKMLIENLKRLNKPLFYVGTNISLALTKLAL